MKNSTFNDGFTMGGTYWRVVSVPPDSKELIDRTGTKTVATTDPNTHTVCIADNLEGDFLLRVLIHELGHCAMVSYDLIADIRRMVVPDYWIEAEEWVCNILADYGMKVFLTAFRVLGYDAWRVVPHELERIAA